MKKLTLLAATAIVMSTFVTSCKKGDGDPAISLRSRKARLTGEWMVKKYDMNSTWTSTSGNTTTTTQNMEMFDGSTYTQTTIYNDGSKSMKEGTGEYKVTLNKDYTFEIVINKNFTKETYTPNNGASVTTTLDPNEGKYSTTYKGSWSFVGKDKNADFKNKERVLLNITEVVQVYPDYDFMNGEWKSSTTTSTYANGQNTMIWNLNTLKNNLIEIVGDIKSTFTNVDYNGNTFTSSQNGSMTIEMEQ